MTIWKPVFALVVLIALAVSPRLVAQEQNTTPTAAVAGAWRLNRDLSTKVPEEMPGSGHEPGGRGRGTGGAPPGGGRGGSPGGGMGGPPGGGMGGPPGGGMGARPSEEEMRRMRGVLREASEAPDQFVIAPGDGMVTITDSAGLVQKFATTNKKERHQTTAGVVETRTKWEGPVLTIETSAGGGLKITRSYRPAPEGRQLVLEVKIENSNVPQQMPPMRFVYEAMSRPETDRLPGD
jgi:hypothetical protein